MKSADDSPDDDLLGHIGYSIDVSEERAASICVVEERLIFPGTIAKQPLKGNCFLLSCMPLSFSLISCNFICLYYFCFYIFPTFLFFRAHHLSL